MTKVPELLRAYLAKYLFKDFLPYMLISIA
jgi:hypothetical protein